MVGQNRPLVLGIDPGPHASGWCFWNGSFAPAADGATPNTELIEAILEPRLAPDCIGIERMSYYGKIASGVVLDSADMGGYVRGWFHRHNGDTEIRRATFPEVAMHHCGVRSAKEAQIRQALIQRFGAGFGAHGKGTKDNPGPFLHVSGHAWSALAVAVWLLDLKTF